MCSLRAWFVLAALLASACAPGVYVRRLVPAPHNLGAARRLALVSVRGDIIGLEAVVLTELKRQVEARRHFALFNALPLRLALAVPPQGQRADLSALRAQVDADYYLVVSVQEFRAFATPVVRADGTRHRADGAARLAIDLVRADGAWLDTFTVSGLAHGPDPFSKDGEGPPPNDLPQRATRAALDKFLGYVTPTFVTEKIAFDDAEELKPGLELAEAEDLAGAQKAWQDLLAKVPTHAGALYNVGVVYEVQGEYEGARQYYRRALELQPANQRYQSAERALVRRLADAARLEQAPP